MSPDARAVLDSMLGVSEAEKKVNDAWASCDTSGNFATKDAEEVLESAREEFARTLTEFVDGRIAHLTGAC